VPPHLILTMCLSLSCATSPHLNNVPVSLLCHLTSHLLCACLSPVPPHLTFTLCLSLSCATSPHLNNVHVSLLCHHTSLQLCRRGDGELRIVLGYIGGHRRRSRRVCGLGRAGLGHCLCYGVMCIGGTRGLPWSITMHSGGIIAS
jgi:hypothetical protein